MADSPPTQYDATQYDAIQYDAIQYDAIRRNPNYSTHSTPSHAIGGVFLQIREMQEGKNGLRKDSFPSYSISSIISFINYLLGIIVPRFFDTAKIKGVFLSRLHRADSEGFCMAGAYVFFGVTGVFKVGIYSNRSQNRSKQKRRPLRASCAFHL